MSGSSPLLQAARVWERTSARGTLHVSGRLGGVRVVIMPNRDFAEADPANSHTHILYFLDGTSTQARPAERAPAEKREHWPLSGVRRFYQAIEKQPTRVAMGPPEVTQIVQQRPWQRHEPLLVALTSDAQFADEAEYPRPSAAFARGTQGRGGGSTPLAPRVGRIAIKGFYRDKGDFIGLRAPISAHCGPIRRIIANKGHATSGKA